jgi:tetratricopeptide (TPR) repeat protein
MRIKSMKRVKAISVLLVASTALLTCKEANAQRGSSYVLPPSAPSNWIINPANPIYSPGGSTSSSDENLTSLFNRAIAEGEKGNYEAKARLFTEMIRINPQGAYSYYNRGLVKKNKLNDRSGAVEDFQMAAQLFRQQGKSSMYRESIRQIQSINEL